MPSWLIAPATYLTRCFKKYPGLSREDLWTIVAKNSLTLLQKKKKTQKCAEYSSQWWSSDQHLFLQVRLREAESSGAKTANVKNVKQSTRYAALWSSFNPQRQVIKVDQALKWQCVNKWEQDHKDSSWANIRKITFSSSDWPEMISDLTECSKHPPAKPLLITKGERGGGGVDDLRLLDSHRLVSISHCSLTVKLHYQRCHPQTSAARVQTRPGPWLSFCVGHVSDSCSVFTYNPFLHPLLFFLQVSFCTHKKLKSSAQAACSVPDKSDPAAFKPEFL